MTWSDAARRAAAEARRRKAKNKAAFAAYGKPLKQRASGTNRLEPLGGHNATPFPGSFLSHEEQSKIAIRAANRKRR